MPIEKLSFFPLTEWQHGNDKISDISKMFRQINGSGDYLGAAIVMDTSIAGSLALAEHLAPFVLPVGIKATLKQQINPTEAVLNCDFTNGFSVKGRADARDGLVIFDNDITNTMKATDNNSGGCTLKHISGDLQAAEYEAMVRMEEILSDMQFRRTNLSQAEKNAYYRGVMADIESNRRTEEPHYTYLSRVFTGHGWESVLIEGLTRAADFHWHTNVQDVSNISNVKFTKEISIKGHKTIERELPTNLCLVYNSAVNSYDRCTEVEEESAKTMQQSMNNASQSDACRGLIDPFECGRKRDSAGMTANRRHVNLDHGDDLLVRRIE